MKEKNNSSSVKAVGKNKIRNDLILMISVLLASCLFGIMFYFLRGEGDSVVVTVDGELFGTYPLTVDAAVEIRTGKNGEEINLLVIRDGKAYVESATCPDGICADHKPIFRDRETIVCLPHRVVIAVRTAAESEDADINV